MTQIGHTHEGYVKTFTLVSYPLHLNFTSKNTAKVNKIYMIQKNKLCPTV